MDMFIEPKYTTLIVFLFVVGLLSVCGYVVVTGTGIVKMYTIDGEMIISDGAININNITISLSEISSMDVRAKDYPGARSSDGSGNWMRIEKKSREKIETRFVIASKIQKNSLGQILQKWKDNGLPVNITI